MEEKKEFNPDSAKEIASKHLGKHAINYITIMVIIGVVSSITLEGGALTAVIGMVSTAAMALIGIIQHIVGSKDKEEKPELDIINKLIEKLDNEDKDMSVDIDGEKIVIKSGNDKITTKK